MSEKCTECGHYIEGERQWISNRCSECADTASATDALNIALTTRHDQRFNKSADTRTGLDVYEEKKHMDEIYDPNARDFEDAGHKEARLRKRKEQDTAISYDEEN
jgi:hypothetical protein